jgi:hypothetical protein
MRVSLFGRHGGQARGALFGIPFAIVQFAIAFSQARRRRAVGKLNDVPLSAARRLPAVPIAATIFHRRIATRLAVTLASGAAARRRVLREVHLREAL